MKLICDCDTSNQESAYAVVDLTPELAGRLLAFDDLIAAVRKLDDNAVGVTFDTADVTWHYRTCPIPDVEEINDGDFYDKLCEGYWMQIPEGIELAGDEGGFDLERLEVRGTYLLWHSRIETFGGDALVETRTFDWKELEAIAAGAGPEVLV